MEPYQCPRPDCHFGYTTEKELEAHLRWHLWREKRNKVLTEQDKRFLRSLRITPWEDE